MQSCPNMISYAYKSQKSLNNTAPGHNTRRKINTRSFNSSLPWLMWSFLIHGYIWGCVESLVFWGVVGALPAGFSSSREEALGTQSRLSSSVPPFELEHGGLMEFFTDLCCDCVSVTGDELATEEHGRGSGGGDRDEFPVLFADWLYLMGSTEGVVAAEWVGE